MAVCLLLSLMGCAKGNSVETVQTTAGTEVGSVETEQEYREVQMETKEVSLEEAAMEVMKEVEETVYTTTGVNVRKAPSTSAEVLRVLPRGSEVTRTGVGESWSRVHLDGKEYYMASRYLSLEKPVTESSQAAENTNVQGGEGIGTKTVGGAKGILVAIDAGHQKKGNSEKEPDGPGSSVMKAKVSSGTAGAVSGLAEYQLTLAVSLKLKEELVKRGYDVYMVREIHEVNLSNSERAKMANESGADIFVRIHGNSIADSSVNGALTMCMTKNNPYNSSLYSKSRELSQEIVDGICAETGFRNRGIQETDTMSGINWCELPVTIVEMGFMSNPTEDRKMATEEYQNKIVKGIADGIDAYYSD